MAKIVDEHIDDIKEGYAEAAFNMSWAEMDRRTNPAYDNTSVQICMENNTGCMPVLPYLPPSCNTSSTEEEWKAQMVEIFGYLLRYSVAVETLVLDQSLSNDELGFMDNMVTLQNFLEDLIVQFVYPLTYCHLVPHPQLVMMLSRRMHVRVDEDLRKLRGFCALRQIQLGAQCVCEAYDI